MPLYEYICKCGHELDKIVAYDTPNPKCPKCGTKMKKKLSKGNFHLKGGGWYKDGYTKKT